MNQPNRFEVLICAVVIFVGMVFLIVGIIRQVSYSILQRDCVAPTYGTVTDIYERVNGTDKDETVIYYPVYEYVAGDQVYTSQSDVGSNIIRYDIGQQVPVMYDPNNPERYYIVGDKVNERFGIIFICIGGVLAILGVLGAIRMTRNNMRSDKPSALKDRLE